MQTYILVKRDRRHVTGKWDYFREGRNSLKEKQTDSDQGGVKRDVTLIWVVGGDPEEVTP